MIEDIRNVSGSLERFLLDRGETVVRLAPRLMADARRAMRTRGKSDPIDALAIARAALREGVDTLPTAGLAGPELEIGLLALHRERLIDIRTRLINELRRQLHDLWPEWKIPLKALIHPGWQAKVAGGIAVLLAAKFIGEIAGRPSPGADPAGRPSPSVTPVSMGASADGR